MSKLRTVLGIIPQNKAKHDFLLNEGFKIRYEGDFTYEFYGKSNNIQLRIFIFEDHIRVIHDSETHGNKEKLLDFNYTNDTWEEVYNNMIEYIASLKYIS